MGDSNTSVFFPVTGPGFYLSNVSKVGFDVRLCRKAILNISNGFRILGFGFRVRSLETIIAMKP